MGLYYSGHPCDLQVINPSGEASSQVLMSCLGDSIHLDDCQHICLAAPFAEQREDQVAKLIWDVCCFHCSSRLVADVEDLGLDS